MFEDLKGEKGMIEHEYNSLLNNQFSKDREREFISEVDTLRNGHSELEREVAALMHDKTDLLNKIKEMNGTKSRYSL